MPRDSYREALDALREDVLSMADLVLERLEMALDALERQDDDLARTVIEGDDEVNQLYLDLEKDCIDLLALQQPVAGDLRFIAASFKIITDLERVADLATNLAEYGIQAERVRFPEVDVREIAEATARMVGDAMTAYEAEDPETCRAIAARDDEVDAMCEAASESVVRDLIEAETDPGAIDELMADVSRLLLTIRDLERVGDHAVNIAARTLYMIETDDELIY